MLVLALMAGVASWCSHRYWMRLGADNSEWRDRYWVWVLQGFVFPWVLWCIFNIGWGDKLPPLVPQIIDAQQTRQPWLGLWIGWGFAGAILIGFYWTAVTYLWLVFRIFEEAQDKKEILQNIAFFASISGIVSAVLVYSTGWIHLGPGLCATLLPVVHFTIDLAEKPPLGATYGKAIGQLKRGKYQDAEWEVITQLEKSEEDFDGWMLLAELYARQYRNMEDAARVIFDICRQPTVQPFQISVACHKLAEWQLEVGENPVGARAALELLCRKLPGTHFARMAEQRIRQIPRTFEEFDELKQPKRIRLPSLREQYPTPSPATSGSRSDAAAEANRLSEKLTDNPDDIPTREKLALVLAEKLGKVELAIEQLTLLGAVPEASDEQKAKWLGQIASWDFNRTKDKDQFRSVLRTIIRTFPATSHAFAAQRRLYLLEMDFTEEHTA